MRSPSTPRDRRRRGGLRPSPALVLAFIALLACVVGPAWAAGLLTGADIRNGTLTGQDVKDGSIGPSDISRTGRAALEGPNGKDGTNGRDGAAGAVGAKGEPGASGVAGPTGPAGPVGDSGGTGPQGPVGPTGAAGVDGADAVALWAQVSDVRGDADDPTVTGGGLDATDPVSAPSALGETVYAVTFDRDVSTCGTVVARRSVLAERAATGPDDEPVLLSATDAEAGGTAYTFHDPKNPDRVRVRLLDRAGNGTEGSFSLVLRCPAAVGR